MSEIKIENLDTDMTITEEDLNSVKGGVLIGLLLPAVQKVRESKDVRVTSWSWGETNDAGF